ncbi:hypothetical protein [Nonomuraea typhae]|uniref:hypothetical protein n=1 Tax=Nonomuraea typhae TaxID=2603600 RepID=UPI0012F8C9AE|nr:hypothetical protein [Nonomuraea typhae]
MATVYCPLMPEGASFLTSSFPAFRTIPGTNFPVTVLAYDAAAQENAYWKFIPFNYGSGNLTLEAFWYADTASSGVVRWDAAIAAITANTDSQDVETDGLATAQAVDDTHLGTTGQRLHSVTLTISNLDSIAALDACFIRVSRLGNHANDTMAGDAFLERAYLSWSDT